MCFLRTHYVLMIFIVSFLLVFQPLSNSAVGIEASQEADKIYGRLALVITFDALNYTVFNKALEAGDLPSFQRIIDNGYMVLGKTIVPSATTAAWAAFATGAPPEVNGVVYTYAVNTTDYRSIPIDEEPVSVGWSDMIHAETLTEVLGRHMIKFGFVYTESKVAVFFGRNGTPTVPVYYPEPYDAHDPNLPLIFRASYIESLVNSTLSLIDSFYEYIKAGEKALVLLDFPEPDSSGHTHGPGSSYYYEMLKIIDTQIGRIIDHLEEIGLWKKTLLIMFTDHSMLDVDPELNIVTPDEKHIVGLPIEHRIVAAGTLVYVYLKDLSQIEEAVGYLKNLSWVEGIWTRVHVDGVNGSLHDLNLNTTYAGDIVISIKVPYYAYPGWVSKGAHGGINTVDVPFIFAGGMLKSDIDLENVSILDMAPTLAGFLGVEVPKDAVGRDLEIYNNFVDVEFMAKPKVVQPGDTITLQVNYTFAYPVSDAKLTINITKILQNGTEEEVLTKSVVLTQTGEFSGGATTENFTLEEEGTYRVYVILLVNGEEWFKASTSIMIISMKTGEENIKLIGASIATLFMGILIIVAPIILKRLNVVK